MTSQRDFFGNLLVRAFLFVAVGLAGLLLVDGRAMAEIEGTYNVTGINPGNRVKYSGTVLVQRTGDTFQVIWAFNSQRIIGVGIGKNDYLAVSYRLGENIGVAVYTPSGDGWVGIWAPGGGRELGSEAWVRSQSGP